MIGLKTFKVFFVDVDGVILLHAPLHPGNESFHRVLVVLVLLNLLAKAFDVALFGEVYILRPSPFDMLHAGVLRDYALGVDFCLAAVRGRVNRG